MNRKLYYKNSIDLKRNVDPIERKKNISKEIIHNADFLPQTLGYEDIDRAFKEWVEKKIVLVSDGEMLPTMVLYSNQRFSEYLQTWNYTDNNNNIRLNFKTISRETNPSHGTILGDTYNIPGDRFYTIKSLNAIDDSGKEYKINYKMRQPTPVDLIYKISVMTNKYKIINEFNESIHSIFRAKQEYISPNGHYMSITLENVSDDSEYNIDDRQFFSQSCNVKIKGYIIRNEDLKVEENPIATIICFEGEQKKRRKPTIELTEFNPCFDEEENYYKKNINIDIDLSNYPCKGKIKFTMDEDFILTGITFKNNNNIITENIKLFINDVLITNNLKDENYENYIKCDVIPEDANDENTLKVKKIPSKKLKFKKYIIFENEYYKWHQIYFKNDDEIIIQVKRINNFIETNGFTLNGYNRFK